MDSSSRATFAVGVAAGYVVGRTKKEKLALGLLSLVTGGALDPTARIGQGIRKLAEHRQIEQFSEILADALAERTRALLDGTAEEAGAGRPAPDDDGGEDADDGADTAEEAEQEEEAEEPEEDEAEPSPPSPPAPSRRSPRAKATAPSSSAHAAGPKNPPAAKAKAMAQKAKAERSARKPGPKNPPAAKAAARKAANDKAGAERTARKRSASRT